MHDLTHNGPCSEHVAHLVYAGLDPQCCTAWPGRHLQSCYNSAVLLAGLDGQLLMQLGERVGRRQEQRRAAEAKQQALLQAKAREQEQFEAIKAEFGVDTTTVRSDVTAVNHAHDLATDTCFRYLQEPCFGLSMIYLSC